MNPFGILYKELSEGLHAQTDEQCLAAAVSVRESMLFLVRQVLEARDSARLFTDGMRKLLDKKSQLRE
jgi:hypothetical protein